jgi:hypothetical protein
MHNDGQAAAGTDAVNTGGSRLPAEHAGTRVTVTGQGFSGSLTVCSGVEKAILATTTP